MAAINPKSSGLSELWSRLRFVLLALIIYRIGTHIPVPGIDPVKISSLFDQNQGTLLGQAKYLDFDRIKRRFLQGQFQELVCVYQSYK